MPQKKERMIFMKRICSLLLALVMVIGMFPATATAAELDNGLQYEVYEDHVEITGYTGDATDLIIPAEIEGLPVTAIATPWIVSFDCPNLRTISLPATLTRIIGNPFRKCENLIAIYVDEANPNFFHSQNGCLLVNHDKTLLLIVPAGTSGVFAIPEGVDTVTIDAFDACSQITSIVVHDGVTQLGNTSFGYGIDDASGLSYSVAGAFTSCTNLVRFNVNPHNPVYASSSTGALYTKDYATLLCVPASTTGSYTIAENPSTIAEWSFSICNRITKVFVPSSVSRLEQSAFWGCDELKEIYFAGNAPELDIIEYSDWVGTVNNGSFYGITADIYYPANNKTWLDAIAYADGHVVGDGYNDPQYTYDYGGNITWVPYTVNPFTDVPAGCWYEAPVLWALENGVTSGSSETTFSPGDKCLRAHVVTFLWKAEKSPEPSAYTKSFSDVPAGAWYYKPVHWAVEHGITSGVSDTKFGAGDVCSRYQVVFFLWKAAGSPEPKTTVNPFTDVNPGHFFYKAVLWAVENGITSGTSATTFGPTAPCNRAQVVTFLYAAYN